MLSGHLFCLIKARGDVNSAISGLSESLGISWYSTAIDPIRFNFTLVLRQLKLTFSTVPSKLLFTLSKQSEVWLRRNNAHIDPEYSLILSIYFAPGDRMLPLP
jgi:hypothetical protein